MTTLPASIALNGNVSLPRVPETKKPSFPRRLGRIVLILILSAALSLLLLYTGFHAYIAWKLTHPDVAPLSSNPLLAKNLAYEDVTFPSSDHSSMVDGWWIPAGSSNRSIVLSHGYGANREEYWVPMYDLADLLHHQGYNVLMFDYGFASGRHGLPATGGYLESRQLLGAIEYARRRGTDELIVWGFSMGAGTALQAALQEAPVDAMILDSTFLPSEDTISYTLVNSGLQLPTYPTIPLVKWFFPLMSGTNLKDLPVTRALTTPYDFPIFLIHGTADRKAPAYLAENVAAAQTHPSSRLWIVEGAIHEMIYRTHTDEYVARITEFLGEVHVLVQGNFVPRTLNV